MEKETKRYNFIIIDDSKLDCFIAEKVVLNTGRGASVKAFTNAKAALSFIQSSILPQDLLTVVLVDINMPLMDGFEFIAEYEATIPEEQKKYYHINMLSSSINESDMIKAKTFPTINNFLNKPLNKAVLEQALDAIIPLP